MIESGNALFMSLVSRLDSFYPLVELVNSRDVLSSDDLVPYFDSSFVDEILHLQHAYLKSGKLRSCGNPVFVHSLRCLIWSKAFNCDSYVSRVILYHDYVEDFGDSLESYDSLMSMVPSDIQTPVNFLTNKYRVIFSLLDFSKGLLSLVKQLSVLSSNDLIEPCASHLLSLFSTLDDVSKEYFVSRYYELYLIDLIEYVSSTNDDSPLIAKFFDRLDNTLTELPSKFETIMKLYDKNIILLEFSKDYVLSSRNPMLKLLYVLLFVRSISQATFLREQYASITTYRGTFYGQQYSKVCETLDLEGHKLSKFSSVCEQLFNDSLVKKLISDLESN